VRVNDEEMMEGIQPKEEKIIKDINKQWRRRSVCGLLWICFLLFVDNPVSSTLFIRLTAWHHLLHMVFAKKGDGKELLHTERKVEERSGRCHCCFSIWLTEA